MRLSALGLICESHRTTEPPELTHLSLLMEFVELNANSQSPGFRYPVLTAFKKVCLSVNIIVINITIMYLKLRKWIALIRCLLMPRLPYLLQWSRIYSWNGVFILLFLYYYLSCSDGASYKSSIRTLSFVLFVCFQLFIRIRDSSYTMVKAYQKNNRTNENPDALIAGFKVNKLVKRIIEYIHGTCIHNACIHTQYYSLQLHIILF